MCERELRIAKNQGRNIKTYSNVSTKMNERNRMYWLITMAQELCANGNVQYVCLLINSAVPNQGGGGNRHQSFVRVPCASLRTVLIRLQRASPRLQDFFRLLSKHQPLIAFMNEPNQQNALHFHHVISRIHLVKSDPNLTPERNSRCNSNNIE